MQINWVLYDRDIGSVHVFTQFSPPFPPFCWGGWVCFFDVQKRIAFKTLFTCVFILELLNYLHLPSYGSEPRKRYTLRLSLMCLEVEGWGKFGSCSAYGDR